MARLVHDRDGRSWTVGARVHLVQPGAGRVPVEPADAVLRTVLLGVSALLVLVVVLSTPASLWLPGWISGPVLLAAAAAVVLWALGRPWCVTAATGGSIETGEGVVDERWVRGAWAAHREVALVCEELATWSSEPDRDLAGDLPFRS